MMTTNFCTLFDKNYLYRGLVMYNSLKNHCPSSHLYVLCFDDTTLRILRKLALQGVTLISMEEFEDEELRRVKKDRTRAEYCWTCASSLIFYIMSEYPEVPSLTYVDADLMFFSSPAPVVERLGKDSVLITPHRYTPRYDKSAESGIYCVQFVTFKRDENGSAVLEWWRERCLEWCYDRVEEGRFGDQKYLDDWPGRFKGVHVSDDIGVGVAPWNVQQYEISRTGERLKADGKDVVFYHYHYFKSYTNGQYDLGIYDMPDETAELIYRPYIEALAGAKRQVLGVDGAFDYGEVKKYKDWTYPLRFVNRVIRGYYHVIR